MLKEHETEDHTLEPGLRAKDSSDIAGSEPSLAGQRDGAAEDRLPEADSDSQGGIDLKTALEERDRALTEKAELLDKFQRAQAEFDNWRKRLLREKQEAQEYAAMSTIEPLLPIVDDLERAIQTPGLDPDFKKGLELIYQRISDVFTRAGMTPIDDTGKFDPHLHHAVDRAPAESDEHDQTILEVYQRGYHFKDRLLRPAIVKVAVKD
jgi:molecular chaperone GrpE